MISIDKRDLVTMVSLSLVFFSIASWNLGRLQVPTSTWEVTETREVIIDLGTPKEVDELLLLMKNGEIKLTLFTGNPEKWDKLTLHG